ncbi:APC family permease [Paenibacillus sp. WLX1005]|uniref:APC family permease n=1 Tax=Paenibacillus sp. WLX1005 TaxID=3243766 RepID=UPI00398457B8
MDQTTSNVQPHPRQQASLMPDALGVPGLVFFVISAAAPLMALMGTLTFSMGLGNGVGAPGIYVLALILWMLFAVGYTSMSRHVRNTGAFYAYVSKGLGKVSGISASLLAIVSYCALLLALYGLVGNAFNSLLMEVGIHLPWWVYSILCCVIVGVLGYRRVDVGAKLLGVCMIMEVIILLIIAVAALTTGTAEGYTAAPFQMDVLFGGSPGIAIMYCMGAFIGFEATVIYGEEAKNPNRTIPVATYTAVGILGLLYAFISYSIVIGWGETGVMNKVNTILTQGLDPASLFTDLAASHLGNWSVWVLRSLFVTSAFAGLIAYHNVIARYLFSMGRSGILPAALSRLHTHHRSPHIAGLLLSILSLIFIGLTIAAGWDPFLQTFAYLSAMASLGLLCLYTVVGFAILSFFIRTGTDRRLWHSKIAPLLSAFGLLAATLITIINFPSLVGTSASSVPLLMEFTLALVAVVGVCIGIWLKLYRPSVYEQAGESIAEAESEAASSSV